MRLVFRFLVRVVTALAAAVVLLAVVPPGAVSAPRADTGVGAAADALRQRPVYVDPRMADQFDAEQADDLAQRIEEADRPVFVAVLPETAEFPPSTLLRDLRTEVGIAGVYAVRLGERFDAGADSAVMSRGAVANLTGSVERNAGGGVAAQLDSFVEQALRQADGRAPEEWSGGATGDGGAGVGALGVLAAVGAAGGAGALLLHRRGVRRRAEGERAALERLRTVVDEDITAFGEELDRLAFDPADPASDDAMRQDFSRALDAYERAKSLMASARGPGDVTAVTEELEDGRFALATLAARREGRPLPERRGPCFFDPRHGPSVTDVEWAPPGGARRSVPVCAADAARIEDGEEPMARTVDTPNGRQPYWDAGPVYGPWAGGYFGGGLLPGLLVGTMLGSSLAGPSAYAAGWGDGAEGGEYTGADYDPGDFGGGGGFDGGGGFGDGGGF